ncbi:cAMP-specific 3',5'-cyclic phosphodiesterase 4B [Clonorchis sinensis]|uniref:cAMP-specific 3',5'-cyclic phosphodiesterase 4B n=1 Tax=Clonorchis sinensis TaxID=79923 RepID=A0A419PM63_CLOSI|nr:cAMP-specific 3',5'-cyclic phosphodiesterase 4B [Clonorchis sinensis]
MSLFTIQFMSLMCFILWTSCFASTICGPYSPIWKYSPLYSPASFTISTIWAVTNQYLINTNNGLAILYNNKSVLENHQSYIGFDLFHSELQVDITKHFTTVQRQLFRKIVISLVLATNMPKHMTLLADSKTIVESQRASGSNEIKLDTLLVRIQILEYLVHASDLSSSTKPMNVYRQWVKREPEELFQQGDRERGLEISPMCERHTSSVRVKLVSSTTSCVPFG